MMLSTPLQVLVMYSNNFACLKVTKNLLAFSGGIDSTALFFILIEHNIPFDIAIVNYNTRPQSIEEEQYAHFLAQKYNKNIYVKSVPNEIKTNFEMTARNIRYDFFEEVISNFDYEFLLIAHQLNDKLEWFMMQLSRGAGISELFGINEIDSRDNYQICRPLLGYTKAELLEYLEKNKHQYFVDSSNNDMKYTRNQFRKEFSDPFLNKFASGVKRSFEYLAEDITVLNGLSTKILTLNELCIFKVPNDSSVIIRTIDKELKKRGILLSSQTKKEILKQKQIIISAKFCVSFGDGLLWIAPVCSETMDKQFKECTRIAKIPQNIRPYLKKILRSCDEIQKLVASIGTSCNLSLDK